MPKRPKVCVALLLVLGASLAAAKGTRDQYAVTAARQLAARDDPRSLATAALLLQTAGGSGGGLRALDLAERAALDAPDDRLIGWLHLRVCEQTPGCDVAGVATTLRWTDADNAAPWLSMLAGAARDRDEQATERALSGMAEARKFLLYWNPAITMVFDAIKAGGIGPPPGMSNAEHSRLDAAYGFAALTLPALRPLTDACRDVQGRPRRHDNCVRIAGLLQRSDAIAAQTEGYSMQKHLFPPDSREVRTAVERQRSLESRLRAERRFETAFLPWFNNRLALHRLALMRQFAREEDVMNAILREHHVNGDSVHD